MTNNFLHTVVLLCFAAIIKPAFAAEPLRVAFVIGEDEYNTKETLPAFAEQQLKPAGIEATFIQADEKLPNHFPGIEKIDNADVLFLSIRRRPMPKDEMAHIRKLLSDGKPLVAIRTSCHAFAARAGTKNKPENIDEWPDFDVQVLGGHYTNHFGNKEGTEITVLPDAKTHPILAGINVAAFPSGDTLFHSGGTLYKCGELNSKTVRLLDGATIDQGQAETRPVAWTHEFGKSRVFFTSLGHPDDFKAPAFNRILLNAIRWAADNQR